MVFNFNEPGEVAFVCSGSVGLLEGVIAVPLSPDLRYLAILGHPHSLQGGSMSNKVVTTLARVFKELSIPSIRFNFRGVGQSEGVYDAGVGESEDMMVLAALCQRQLPGVQFIFAGFSFGSYVTYRAAAKLPHALLISIAPPVHHYDFNEFVPAPSPWLIVHGDEDEVVPVAFVRTFVERAAAPIEYIECAGTSHFFHGKLIDLRTLLIQFIQKKSLL